MKYLWCAVSALALGSTAPAWADPISLTPEGDLRIRDENIDQANLDKTANGLTARLRLGIQAQSGPWTALVEGEGLLAMDYRYNSFTNGKIQYPSISDPQNIALNRVQLRYSGIKNTAITVGRQRINIDDERFIASQGWRSNEQVFDAIRVETSPIKNLKIDATYAWSVRTIYGIDGTGARPGHINGDNGFFNASYKTLIGTLTGFAYLIDQDAPLLYTKSNQTYGARLAGGYKIAKTVKADYMLSYATQSDYRHNPNRYRASYYAADLQLDFGGPQVGGRYEVLGADKGLALTSFQTPYASLNRYQGWADMFLATPPNGIRDAQATVGYLWKQVGPLKNVLVQATYHHFESDRLDQHYGAEWDFHLGAKFSRYSLLTRYAKYRADKFGVDTRKIWVQFGWSFGPQ